LDGGVSTTLLTLGGAIRAERNRRALTLREVAARGFISASFVAEVERGEKSPTVPMLEALARGLGMTLGALLLLIAQEVDE
jgi:transcriptional regulator with XRE-family HTH domain